MMEGPGREKLEETLVNRWILDQFRIVERIGRGGMGQIFLAEQASMDRYAVIKILLDDQQHQDELRLRFRREARALSKLNHPNIVTVYAFGELANGMLAMAMEHVVGVSLEERLAKGPIPPAEAVEIGLQCARALAHAHKKQIVHRDFKPSNVMITRFSGRLHVKVLDFGIALLEGDNQFTRTGSLIGTPRYMSPEQCRGDTASPLSDQYALGLVLYEMLVGRPAIDADTPMGYLHRQQHFVPPRPSELIQAVGVEVLDPIVLRMQAKDAGDRYPSMEEVCEALEHSEGPPVRTGSPATGTATSHRHGPRPSEAVTATLDDSGGRHSTSVLALGKAKMISDEDWALLGQKGIVLQGQVAEPAGFPARAADDHALCLLGLPGGGGDECWEEWLRAELAPHRTLVCVDARLGTQGLVEQLPLYCNFLVGRFPVDPVSLYTALIHLRQKGTCGKDRLLSDEPLKIVEIVSSKEKRSCIESMLEDARAAGLRSSVRLRLRDIADEMIMNAIFHAPVDAEGQHYYASLDRSTEVNLCPHESVTIRWAVGDRFFILAVRDHFGSLPTQEIISPIAGPAPQPRVGGTRLGTGMGLRIMSQNSRHLLFAICPGEWCEIVSLVDRDLSSGFEGERSLAVVQHREVRKQLGAKLWCVESGYQRRVSLKLEGAIDESCDLLPVFQRSGAVRLHLREVTSVNSMGIRRWLEAAKERDPELALTFTSCSPAIVRQINMVPAFADFGHVESLLAPYFCKDCDCESMELVSTTEAQLPPIRRCSGCGGELTFDEIPGSYFGFLK